MIPFHRAAIADKAQYDQYLMHTPERGCEYSFANLFLWGRQELAFRQDCVLLFSHFYGRSVYPFPIGPGDRQAALTQIIADARQRGIPCRLTGMSESDKADLEAWFPGLFDIRPARDSFDYVYSIDALADLRGKKLQKKRNHVNRFRAEHPQYRAEPLSCENIARVHHMVNDWYIQRRTEDPLGDYLLESLAMVRGFRHFEDLQMEGIALVEGDEILAVTLGSRMGQHIFDIHFEKAREDVNGAYAAINCEFARYLRDKFPELQYLNREDDLGLEGLRKAKLSYNPDHLVEKYQAVLREDIYED